MRDKSVGSEMISTLYSRKEITPSGLKCWQLYSSINMNFFFWNYWKMNGKLTRLSRKYTILCSVSERTKKSVFKEGVTERKVNIVKWLRRVKYWILLMYIYIYIYDGEVHTTQKDITGVPLLSTFEFPSHNSKKAFFDCRKSNSFSLFRKKIFETMNYTFVLYWHKSNERSIIKVHYKQKK